MKAIKEKFFKIFKIIIIILISIIIVLIFGNVLSSFKVKEAEQCWAKNFYSFDYYGKHFPKREANRSALELEKLATKIGINLAPSDKPNRAYPIDNQMSILDSLQKEINKYLDSQLVKQDNSIDMPPEKILNFLSAQNLNLETIKNYVLHNETPYWEMDIKDTSLISPDIDGMLRLQRMLMLEILEKTRTGDHQAALDIFEASWKINKSMKEHAQMFPHLLARATLELQVVLLRKLAKAPSDWQKRLAEYDYQQSLFISKEIEIWHISHPAKHLSGLAESSLFDRYILDPIFRPFNRLCFADLANKTCNAFLQVQKEDICAWDSTIFDKQFQESIAKWNLPGRMFATGFEGWNKFAILKLNTELTQKILLLKELKSVSKGKILLSQLPSSQASFCKNSFWKYQINSDGTICISLSIKPKWYNEEYFYVQYHSGPVFPFIYCIK